MTTGVLSTKRTRRVIEAIEITRWIANYIGGDTESDGRDQEKKGWRGPHGEKRGNDDLKPKSMKAYKNWKKCEEMFWLPFEFLCKLVS